MKNASKKQKKRKSINTPTPENQDSNGLRGQRVQPKEDSRDFWHIEVLCEVLVSKNFRSTLPLPLSWWLPMVNLHTTNAVVTVFIGQCLAPNESP